MIEEQVSLESRCPGSMSHEFKVITSIRRSQWLQCSSAVESDWKSVETGASFMLPSPSIDEGAYRKIDERRMNLDNWGDRVI